MTVTWGWEQELQLHIEKGEMMKTKNISVGLVSTFLLLSIAFAHEHHQHQEQQPPLTNKEQERLQQINKNYVEAVKPIFQKSCFNCHSNQTVFPWYSQMPGAKQLISSDITEAKKHIDMANDFPFTGHGTPKEDLEAIAKSVTEKTMPPFRYKIMHWKSELTKQEQETVIEWTKNSLNLLSQVEKK